MPEREGLGDLEVRAVQPVIGVRERHPLPGRVLQPEIPRRRLTAVRLREHLHPEPAAARPRREQVERAVRRAVVDGDDLEALGRHSLALDGPDELGQVRLDVVDRRDDRESGSPNGLGAEAHPRRLRTAR
jgi:hypothetical protein